MTALAAARVVTPAGVLEPGVVELDGDRIGAVSPASGRAPDRTLVPGLVDLQVNGVDDVDVAGATAGDWDALDAHLVAQGVTAWCPTLVTAPLDAYAEPLARIAAAAARPGPRPAILGAHLEGPFLGTMPGAHPRQHVVPVDEAWLAALPGDVALVTLAPECPGALDAVARLRGRGVTVALGHSGASYAEAVAAIDAGATLVTHCFNGMAPLHHREPGLAGAALHDRRVAVSVIADLVHVHPAVVGIVFAAAAGRTVLVTDSVAWRARRVGGVGFRFDGRAARLPDGRLAGSALTLDRAVGNAVHHCGVGLAAAVAAASTTPARLLGHADRGRLEAGARADVVALGPDLRATSTWIGGEQVWP